MNARTSNGRGRVSSPAAVVARSGGCKIPPPTVDLGSSRSSQCQKGPSGPQPSPLARRRVMRKLIVHEFITLDGVIQAPGGADEDRDGGFAHGGWTHPYWHDDIGMSFGALMQDVDAF